MALVVNIVALVPESISIFFRETSLACADETGETDSRLGLDPCHRAFWMVKRGAASNVWVVFEAGCGWLRTRICPP